MNFCFSFFLKTVSYIPREVALVYHCQLGLSRLVFSFLVLTQSLCASSFVFFSTTNKPVGALSVVISECPAALSRSRISKGGGWCWCGGPCVGGKITLSVSLYFFLLLCSFVLRCFEFGRQTRFPIDDFFQDEIAFQPTYPLRTTRLRQTFRFQFLLAFGEPLDIS